ncbi:MAG: porin family protein [Treponema sp.]|nr:porin family protein [Treponema sp.]
MKKILASLILLAGVVSTAPALSLAVGGRGFLGGNLQTDDSGLDGFMCGLGAFLNLDLIGGFGFQGEVNYVANQISTGSNSVTFTHYEILDFPLYVWYNLKLNPIVLGAGAGINFSNYPGSEVEAKGSFANVGLAAGANLKVYVSEHFGIVLGATGVFDFFPTIVKTENTENNSTTYTFSDADYRRKSIYGSLGLEYRF